MGLPFDLVPFTKRNMPEEARIYSHLPQDFRMRFHRITQPYIHSKKHITTIYNDFYTEFSENIEYFDVHSDGSISKATSSHVEFLLEGDEEYLVDYLEYALNYMYQTTSKKELLKIDDQLRRALREERVLFRIRPSRSDIEEAIDVGGGFPSSGFKPSSARPVKLEYIGSEPMVQADEDISVLGFNSKWAKAVNHYNTAWEYYQEGRFNSTIPEELAKAIESVANTICKEDNNWVDDGAGLGACLNEMKNQDLFKPNDALYPEAEKIFVGLKLSAQKAAGDKHRHQDVNQHYVLLLLHQTAAFMTYVINRYEELS